jgi:hypothetical protein
MWSCRRTGDPALPLPEGSHGISLSATILTMHRSGLAIVLLVYLTLDFANPLMPGAVRFERGSVDSIQGDRARPVVPSVSLELAPTPEAVIDRLAQVQASQGTRWPAEPRRLRMAPIRRAPLPSPDPLAPSEDH